MSISSAESGTELVRAGVAVDDLLEQLRRELHESLLPQRDFLLECLYFEKSVSESVLEFVQLLLELDVGDAPQLKEAFLGASLNLGLLEDALAKLLRAVSWSARFSGFNWWLLKRQQELGVSDKVVIPAPGSARDFLIDREPALAKFFAGCREIIVVDPERLDRLARIRLLTVPQADGGSPRWHPITLGHELAHLRFDRTWVESWLAGLKQTEHAEPAKFAIECAVKAMKAKVLTSHAWYTELLSWLCESACDATTAVLYQDEGVACLDAYLGVHSLAENTQHHPSPSLRLASLRASKTEDLEPHREGSAAVPTHRDRVNAYCQLTTFCQSAVRQELDSFPIEVAASDETMRAALEAHGLNAPPMASEWDVAIVMSQPTSIETGLVRSLWHLDGQEAETMTLGSELMKARALREIRSEHAVDFLQFLHRFEVRRPVGGVSVTSPLTNVLWVTERGIGRDNGSSKGSTSHDVRLGRHFIVFQRNEISTLDTIESKATRRIQRRVEIGWGDEFILHPGEMVLAVTLEHIVIANDCTAQVLSRSSIGRMGLLSATAVHVQPGFRGCLTLELVNLASVPLKLSPGQRVAQLVPGIAVGKPSDYSGKYQDQDWRPRSSAGAQDWEMPILRSLREDRFDLVPNRQPEMT